MSKKLRTRWQNFLLRASFCPIWGTKMVLFWFCVVTFLSRRCVISVSGLMRLQLRVGNKKRRRRTFALCSISLSSPLFVCLPSVSLLSRAEESGWSDGLSVLFFLQSRQEVGNDEGASADEYHVIGPGCRLCCGISFAHGGVAPALEPVSSCFPGKLLA